jgi:hypothetical protein
MFAFSFWGLCFCGYNYKGFAILWFFHKIGHYVIYVYMYLFTGYREVHGDLDLLL